MTIEGGVSAMDGRRQRRLRERYGPWAVVTGASDGIGRQMAPRLAEAGVNVVLAARRGKLLEAQAEEMERHNRVATRTIAEPGGPQELIHRTAGLDIGLLVAAAGFGTSGNFVDSPARRRAADGRPQLPGSRGAHPSLRWPFPRTWPGRSGADELSRRLPGRASRGELRRHQAYVQSLAEALHVELGPLEVDVIASAPGPIHSGFAARAGMQMSTALPAQAVAQATLDALGRRSTVRPGWLSKFLEASLRWVTRWGRVRIMARVMRGMTHRASAHPSSSG